MCISLYLAAKTNNADETSIARVVLAAFLIEFITATFRLCALTANKPIGSPLVGIVYWPTRAMIAEVKKIHDEIHDGYTTAYHEERLAAARARGSNTIEARVEIEKEDHDALAIGRDKLIKPKQKSDKNSIS